jgi:hypothetical protein
MGKSQQNFLTVLTDLWKAFISFLKIVSYVWFFLIVLFMLSIGYVRGIFVILIIVFIIYLLICEKIGKMVFSEHKRNVLDHFLKINEYKIYREKIFLHDELKRLRDGKINQVLLHEGEKRQYFLVDAQLYYYYKSIPFTQFIIKTPTILPDDSLSCIIIKQRKLPEVRFLWHFKKRLDATDTAPRVDLYFPCEKFGASGYKIPVEQFDNIMIPSMVELITSASEKFAIGDDPVFIIITRDYVMLSYQRITDSQKIWNLISFGKHMAGLVEKHEIKPNDDDKEN